MLLITIAILCGEARAERLRSPDGEVREVPEASVEAAVKIGYRKLPKVMMRQSDGEVVLMDEDLVDSAIRIGLWRMTSEEIANYQRQLVNREQISKQVLQQRQDDEEREAVEDRLRQQHAEREDAENRNRGIIRVGGLVALLSLAAGVLWWRQRVP